MSLRDVRVALLSGAHHACGLPLLGASPLLMFGGRHAATWHDVGSARPQESQRECAGAGLVATNVVEMEIHSCRWE